MDYIRKTELKLSLRRIIKTFGFKDFVQMGVAAATSRKMAKPAVPRNEARRRVKVAETGIIGQDLSSQFEIFGEMVKLVTGADFSMVNILNGKNQFTIGGSGIPVDPLMAMPQDMSICQYALTSPEPFIVADLSDDERFAGSMMTKPPMNASAYAGFPLNTPEGVVLGTLCAFHKRPIRLNPEQVRMMRQLAKATTDQILLRTQKANLYASEIGAFLGRFVRFAPDGTISELIGFLDFCAHGAALPEVITALEKDGIITQIDENWMLTQDGVDLKAELGLAEDGYRGAQVNVPSVGSQLEDLLEKME